MVLESGIEGILLLVGRLLFGGLLAFSGLNHFLNLEQMAGYAEHQGAPAPTVAVAGTGLLLLGGGLGIVLGIFPTLAAGALVVFFLGVTPLMHDFWALEGEEAQTEMTQFLKNAELLGGAVVFLAIGRLEWAYALNVGL